MKRAVTIFAAALALSGTQAQAAVTFDFLFDNGYPIAVSSDGSVITGTSSTGGYETLRWTQASGPVLMGRVQHVGTGGLPGISADGSRIASSIASLDSSYTTQGLWTQATGWQELMPPLPPDGGITDGSYGNVWALSGDGRVPVGLYWRNGYGRAHASKWTAETGVVDLGGTLTNQSSRANGVNYNGSVIAGWVETPTGPWRPAAWVDGSLHLLTDYYEAEGIPVGSGEAKATNPSGEIIVGFAFDLASHQRAAAMWKRTSGGNYGPTQILGWVDGTEVQNGLNIAYGASANGQIVVGYCSYDGSPFGTTGFIWTPGIGVQDINVYLADNGVLVDPNFTIQSLTTITPDGTRIFGYGQMLTPPYARRAFRITLPILLAAPGPEAVARVELSAPRPNPSRASTRLDFALTSAGSVDLAIFDTAGRRVATLVHGDQPAGRSSALWDGREVDGRLAATGLYFARLVTPTGSASQRIVRMN